MKTLPINTEQETTAIFTLLKELDSFYKEDRFLIRKVLYPQEEWTVAWLGAHTTVKQFVPTDDNIRELIKGKSALLKSKGWCTDKYISILEQRIASDTVMNLGMLLTGHEWGDNLSGLLADATYLDYLPMFDAEGYNPVLPQNEKLGENEIDAWHKRRIAFIDQNAASYTLLYTELGIAIEERELAFFIIGLKKVENRWKIDDMAIKEDSRKNILSFYGKSMDVRVNR
jgi:hypothetical protein